MCFEKHFAAFSSILELYNTACIYSIEFYMLILFLMILLSTFINFTNVNVLCRFSIDNPILCKVGAVLQISFYFLHFLSLTVALFH